MFEPSIEELAARLRLHRQGNAWRGECPACGYAGTLSLTSKEGRPVWWCASCQDQRSLTAAIRNAMGADWSPPPSRQKVKKPKEADTRSLRAVSVFERAVPIAGTPAANYLANRGLATVNSAALRFHDAVRHPNAGGTYPAMLALVVNSATREPMAVHRTYLRPDGSGKAGLDPAKASKGPIRGGAIMLDALQPGRPLVIGEGIETSLSAGVLLGVPAWAAIAAGNMVNIRPPRGMSEMLIAADPDEPGQRAAEAAARRWRALGVRVRIITPPEGSGDFNDLLVARISGKGTA